MWSEVREWVFLGLAVGGLLWQAYEKLRRNVVKPEDLKAYATTNDLMASNKALQDGIDANERTISNVDHKVAMVMKDVQNLPTHATVQELRKDIGELKTGSAENKVKLTGVDEKVDMLRDSFHRLDEFLRTAK